MSISKYAIVHQESGVGSMGRGGNEGEGWGGGGAGSCCEGPGGTP